MSHSKNKFYTTGYTGKNVADLKPLLQALDAMLVDVRFSPESRRLEWRKIHLKELLDQKYRHVQQLGNRFFREGKIAIQNLDLGLKIVASFGSNVVLMCGCAEKKTCHRLVIALELQKRGYEVEEIESWTVAEPTLF